MADEAELQPVWIVGFTGHRHLGDLVAVREIVREELERLRHEIDGGIAGYSSAAIGADTLFAEACQAEGIPWIATLPFSPADFRKDFNESQWSYASELLRGAAEIEICGTADDRTASYLRCGLKTVDQADLVMAVWDRNPARGVGGTAEVVAYARMLNKPLILIHPERLDVNRESFFPSAFVDPELAFLNRVGGKPAPAMAKAKNTRESVERFFCKVDTIAARIAPRFRRWVAASLLMNLLAAILAAAAIGFEIHSKLFHFFIGVLVVAAALAIVWVKRKEAHRKWIRCRVAAEICRSALATWDLPVATTPVWFQQFPGFVRLVRTLRILRLESPNDHSSDLPSWRQNYVQTRIDHQIDYFGRRSRTMREALLILASIFWFFSGLAVARALFVATISMDHLNPALDRTIESFLPIALPLAAGGAVSLISILDLHRRRRRFLEMKRRLVAVRDQIIQSDNFITLQAGVEKVEDLCAEEVVEWFMLARNPRFQ